MRDSAVACGLTVTVQLACRPFCRRQVTVAVPAPLAVISPLSLTKAIVSSEEA